MNINMMYLGYWYPRTTLHMSEIFDFLRTGISPLPLNKTALRHLHSKLDIAEIKIDEDILERIEFVTGGGIQVRVYEDGLVILGLAVSHYGSARKQLEEYFNNCYSPAVSYLFSLGAPLPKELAHITSENPLFLVADKATEPSVKDFFKSEGGAVDYQINDSRVDVYRYGRLYVIATKRGFSKPEHLIEMLIFFREFKTQLHHYLNIHRTVWEHIDRITKRESIKAKDIVAIRDELLELQKTIELVEARIKQMSLYMSTRAKAVDQNGWEAFLTKVLEFRYDNLNHSLDYIASLWTMTKQHLSSTLSVFQDLTARSTRNSVQTLTFVSSIGVVGGILANMRMTKVFAFSREGVVYLLVLLALAVIVNQLIRYLSQFINFKLKSVHLAKKF